VSFADLGREFVRNQKMLMEARRQGIELGAYFGLSFLDSFMRGLRPTELFFLAGEPGAGKSAVAWKAVQMFAERQMRKVPEQRVGTLVLSLEMGIEPSNVRVAGSISGVDGGAMREGRTTDDDLAKIISEWTKRKDIPLFFNFTSQLKVSQARALIVEAIRRHNVGLVVIDHFKYVLSDQRHQNALEEDEEKARFLKEAIAKELNVAVICLAHTTKLSSEDGRPRLRDLRGSYMVAAHADFVGFVYRPYEYAKQQDIDEGKVQRTDAELIWDKNRHGLEGAARFYFDPSTMNVH
jgi:replicative DNA helicase